jgi:hypothetical protein
MCSSTGTSAASRRRLAWSPGLEAGPLEPWCGTATGLQEAAASGEPASATGKREESGCDCDGKASKRQE